MSETEPRENITISIEPIEEEEPQTKVVEYDIEAYEYELQKYRRIQQSMAKANKKYRVNHKEYVNAKQKEYYEKHKHDDAYLQRIRNASSKYYYTHKEAIKERREKKKEELALLEPPKEKKVSKQKIKQERWKNADTPKEEHILMII